MTEDPFDVALDDLDLSEDDEALPESECFYCGAIFAGNQVGHCMGGKYRHDYSDGTYSGCCQNFASLHAFDRHRTGKFDPPARRCLTTDELLANGWAKTGPYDSWRTPGATDNPWRKDQ